ncbi:hypothetical protein B4Q13_21450, partial [Lacticaseibacillus rhamnosus]
QLSALKRSGFFTLQASYTYSKTLGTDNALGDNPEPECAFSCVNSAGQTISWKRFQYGSLPWDISNIFVVAYTYQSRIHGSQGYASDSDGRAPMSAASSVRDLFSIPTTPPPKTGSTPTTNVAAVASAAAQPEDLVAVERIAADVIDELIAEGHLVAGTRADVVRSGVAVVGHAPAPEKALGHPPAHAGHHLPADLHTP